MEPQDFYCRCLAQATTIMGQVQFMQLTNETPDDEWTVHDLINHMLYEISWVPDMLAGRTIAQVGGRYDGDLFDVTSARTNLMARWNEAAEKAGRAAVDSDPESVAHLSYGDTTNADYLRQTGGDILVHSWDLAKAIDVSITFDEAVAAAMWERVKGVDMSSSGLFKPSLPYDETDRSQDKILAHFGRDRNWQPAA